MKPTVFAAAFLTVLGTAASAQNFATSEQPGGVTTSISTVERVQRVYSVRPEAASTSVAEPIYAAPVYEAYEPTTFDSQAYETATDPLPVMNAAPVVRAVPDGGNRPYGEPVDVTPTDDFSQPLGSPQTLASASPMASDGEIGFQSETETSRLLLALEETYASRVSELKSKNLTQRRALLAGFESDASDPVKVIGLAERMRAALAELDAAHAALLAVEERQYTAAMLQVLDASPPRVE